MTAGNDELIRRFYDAFNRHDGPEMAACYAPEAEFSDPVFLELRGEEPGAMWEMLVGRAPDLKVTLVEHEADEQRGTAHWLADYTFSATGRQVHNDVRAEFTFSSGRIATHRDSFDLYRWSRQAIGPVGVLFGWTGLLQGRLQRTARESLREFMAERTAPTA